MTKHSVDATDLLVTSETARGGTVSKKKHSVLPVHSPMFSNTVSSGFIKTTRNQKRGNLGAKSDIFYFEQQEEKRLRKPAGGEFVSFYEV